MGLGVFTVLFSKLPLEQMPEKVRIFLRRCIENGTGTCPGQSHCRAESRLPTTERIEQDKRILNSFRILISARASQENPLHLTESLARVFMKRLKEPSSLRREWKSRPPTRSLAAPVAANVYAEPTGAGGTASSFLVREKVVVAVLTGFTR